MQTSTFARDDVGLDRRLAISCALALAAGCIHVEAAVEHVREYALFAVFFAVLSPTQLLWGAATYRRPTPRLLRAGMFGSLAIAALWLISRTVGLPLGPEIWKPEEVGPLDVLATLDELCLALALFSYLIIRRESKATRCLPTLVVACGLVLTLASSLGLVASGHVH